MKSQSYMTRAMKAHDPRYARVLNRLGYERTDMQAAPQSGPDDLASVREEYFAVIGKRPYHGWDVAELRKKIAAHKGA